LRVKLPLAVEAVHNRKATVLLPAGRDVLRDAHDQAVGRAGLVEQGNNGGREQEFVWEISR